VLKIGRQGKEKGENPLSQNNRQRVGIFRRNSIKNGTYNSQGELKPSASVLRQRKGDHQRRKKSSTHAEEDAERKKE